MRLLLVLCFAVSPVCALAQSTPPLTVDEAVIQAVKNNLRLSAATRDILAARSGVRSAQSLANPEIVFTPATAGGSDQELLIQQPLEINGVRAARTGIARAQARKAQAQAVIELRTLVFDTKTAYYGLAQAHDRLALARESLHFADEFDRIASQQVELGARPGIEVTQTSIEVARARQQVTLAESEVVSAIAALNTRMGRSPDTAIGMLTLASAASTIPQKEDAVRLALAARAEITAEEAEAEAFHQEARLARAEGLPDLAPQFRAGKVTRGVGDTAVGLGITIPLIDYGGRRNRIRQAEESARAQSDRIAVARNQVKLEIEQALARVHASADVIKSYRQGVLEQSRRLLEGSRIGFQEGKTNIVAVLEAQRTFRAVQAEFTKAQADYALALAEFERATGAVPASLLPEPRRTK